MMDLVCVDPALVHEIWPHVETLIKRAMNCSRLSDYATLEQKVWRGHALLWIAWEEKICAATVTSISIVNGRKQCVIVACAGEQRESDGCCRSSQRLKATPAMKVAR